MPVNEKSLANLKPLKKGYDPRRNMKGVPRDAVEMRKHMRKIAAEIVGGDDNAMTRLDAMIRAAMSSPKNLELVLNALFPKLLQKSVDLTTDGERLTNVIRLKVYNDAAELGEASAASQTTESGDGGE
ncbi:MAG: hypothetical protein BroJett011_78370 [Chloroflexota bacterium]|nr:hypothetical protein [Chloroflexota bacterium]GIK44004.1 MAG: hypothetical protein BroJett011_78370 [Chloroflexota bacterium]